MIAANQFNIAAWLNVLACYSISTSSQPEIVPSSVTSTSQVCEVDENNEIFVIEFAGVNESYGCIFHSNSSLSGDDAGDNV